MMQVAINGNRRQDHERTPIHFLVGCVLDVVSLVNSIGGKDNESGRSGNRGHSCSYPRHSGCTAAGTDWLRSSKSTAARKRIVRYAGVYRRCKTVLTGLSDPQQGP